MGPSSACDDILPVSDSTLLGASLLRRLYRLALFTLASQHVQLVQLLPDVCTPRVHNTTPSTSTILITI